MANITCPHCKEDISLEVGGAPAKEVGSVTSGKNISMVNTEQAGKMKNKINIEGEVINKTPIRTINLKTGGTLDTCDATLVDEVGKIKVQFWGEDVEKINNGTKIRIENGFTNTFKGEVSLTKGKYGILEVL